MFSACETYEKQLGIEKTRLSHQVWSHGGSTLKKKKDIKRPFFAPCRNWPIYDLFKAKNSSYASLDPVGINRSSEINFSGWGEVFAVTSNWSDSTYHIYYYISYIIYHFLMGRSTHNDKELERLHVRLLHLEHFSHHESSSILRRRETAILNKFSILRYQIWLSLWRDN